ncbi:DUF6197 family protein [Nonomuraea rhizosphaerae]|uniref:DUF6197 family protein n=1 Tax=Nonomuraea rhizosphaerae TaxID=2665663 RepID=UPI001C5DEFAC|nr:hypothetical protein [Nonomuraea rhizosphaerae]
MIGMPEGAVLERAADTLEVNGWIRHFCYGRDQVFPLDVTFASEAARKEACRLCPLGAVAVACDLEPDVWQEETRDRNDRRFQAAEDAAWRLINYLEQHQLVAPGDSSSDAIVHGIGEWAAAGDHLGIARPLENIVKTMRTAARWEAAA